MLAFFNFFSFLIFYILLIFYYIIYLNVYGIFFIFKQFRFFSYYFMQISTAFYYYKKISIYFLFWRFLIVHVLSFIFFVILILINYIKLKSKMAYLINNFYLSLIIFIKIKIINHYNFYLLIFNTVYNVYIYLIYHLFNFINMDEVYSIFSIFNMLKHITDPLLYRNFNLSLSNKYYLYYKSTNVNIIYIIFTYLQEEMVIMKQLFNGIIKKYILIRFLKIYNKYYLISLNQNILLYIASSIFIEGKIKVFNIFLYIFNILKIYLFYINISILNIMYYIMLYFIYIIIIGVKLMAIFKNIILVIALITFLIKYYYIFFYSYFSVYKHYMLYIPLFEVKNETRFFNFEWVDMRNYFNLIFLHNSIVPLIELNPQNIIYNELWTHLNNILSVYGFKPNANYDIQLFSIANIYNNDTKLLNDVLGVYNKITSYTLLKWYLKYKKKLTAKGTLYFQYSRKKGNQEFIKKGSTKKQLEKFIKHKKGLIKAIPLNKNSVLNSAYKKELRYWKYFNKKFFLTNTRKYICPNINYFIKLNKIPLKAIYVYNNDYYYKYKVIFYYHAKIAQGYFPVMRLLKHHLVYGLYWLKKNINRNDYLLYFNNIFNFEYYRNNMQYKYKIPTFQWSSIRWRRQSPNHLFFNPLSLFQLKETQSWYTYYESKKKKITKNRYFMSTFIKYQYPFSLNSNKNITESLNYCTVLNSYTKIIKKYYYINELKKMKNKRYYKHLFYKLNETILRLFRLKFFIYNEPFKKKQIGLINNNFWYFFDYFKAYKYNNLEGGLNNKHYLNLFFLKRFRKDYIKFRNCLLRYYTLYFRYNYLERLYIKHFYYNKKLPNYIKTERAEWVYESFKINWLLKFHISKDKKIVIVLKKIKKLNNLFKKQYYPYFLYCDYTINSYNELYYIKINNYKITILNKINNLKRFFHFQNKNIKGWSILKYLNSFSYSYHLKHFLWHSPYYYFFQNFNNHYFSINDNITYIFFLKYILDINKKNNIIEIDTNNYSMTFNLFLNVIEIKYYWYNEILYILDNVLHKPYINYAFLNYYNSGRTVSMVQSYYIIDIYRLSISFLFEYYKNFLNKLTRYRYILDSKNYTMTLFLKRYFNIKNLYLHWYVRYRTQIYSKLIYGRFIKRRYRKIFPLKNLYANKIYKKDIMPAWLIWDYYIKLFIYVLLNKYYIKHFFIYFWLLKNNFIFNSHIIIFNYYYFQYIINNIPNIINAFFFSYGNNVLVFSYNIYIKIFNYINNKKRYMFLTFKNMYARFFNILFFNAFYKFSRVTFTENDIFYDHFIFLFFKELVYNIDSNLYYIRYSYRLLINFNEASIFWNNFNIINWYLKLCLRLNWNNFNILSLINNNKWIWLNWVFVMFNNLFEYSISLNNAILIQMNVQKVLTYYLNYIFNFKNVLIYFKSNDLYFRKQRSMGRIDKIFALKKAFSHTVTRRNIYSFKHLTLNINLFKNLYLANTSNYIYILNNIVINNNIFSLFFNSFKYNYLLLISFFYLLCYFSVFIILRLYYKKFYYLFFFCECVKAQSMEECAYKLSNNNKQNKITTKIESNLKSNYKIIFFNTFLNKLTAYKKAFYKSMIIKAHNLKIWNNNDITEGGHASLSILPKSIFNNYFNFLNRVTLMPFKFKKENKNYNFYFFDNLNLNLLNFCMFYWLLIIPCFFFEFILLKYHLRGHVRIKRRWFLLFKLLLNNFKFYIKVCKWVGYKQYSGWKIKYPKTYKGIVIKNNVKKRLGYFFKWNRMSKSYIKMSVLGSYYYWFLKINRYEYMINFSKYFFNFSYKSNYFFFVYVYIFILLWIWINKISKKEKKGN